MRHAKVIVLLAVILAISLAPAIALRFFPGENSVLVPTWIVIESRTGFPRGSVAAVWIMISFVLATLTGSALLLVFAHALARSVREGS